MKGANWRCGIGDGAHTRGKPTRYNNTIVWKFSSSNACKNWGPSRKKIWRVGRNINNSKWTYQATNNWHNDLNNFFY